MAELEKPTAPVVIEPTPAPVITILPTQMITPTWIYYDVPERERRQVSHNQNYVAVSSDKETDRYNVLYYYTI